MKHLNFDSTSKNKKVNHFDNIGWIVLIYLKYFCEYIIIRRLEDE